MHLAAAVADETGDCVDDCENTEGEGVQEEAGFLC